MDDVRAVMDAVGSERAALIGTPKVVLSRCCSPPAIPERTRALSSRRRGEGGDRRRLALGRVDGRARLEDYLAAAPASGGVSTGCVRRPTRPASVRARPSARYEWSKRLIREASTPGPAVAFIRMAREIDVRDVCSSITVPTLVVHRLDDRVCHVENGRFLARSIPGARYLELAGDDHVPAESGRGRRDRGRDPGVPHGRPRGPAAGPGARHGALHRPRRIDREAG